MHPGLTPLGLKPSRVHLAGWGETSQKPGNHLLSSSVWGVSSHVAVASGSGHMEGAPSLEGILLPTGPRTACCQEGRVGGRWGKR